MTKASNRFLLAAVLCLLQSSALLAQGPPQSLGEILTAHRAWPTPPLSIQIVGVSTRDGKKEPIKITATRDQEVAIEYSKRKQAASAKKLFAEEEEKTTKYASTPPGFTQLDLTSVLLVADLHLRAARTSAPEIAKFQGETFHRIHAIDPKRTEFHHAQLKVNDELDLFVYGNGMLAGLTRTFYKEAPRWTLTLSYTFFDYRETNGVLMPYRIDKYVDNKRVEAIEVASYAFDVFPARSLFEPRRKEK